MSATQVPPGPDSLRAMGSSARRLDWQGRTRAYIAAALVVAALAAWLGSGFYTVKADQRGVVRRFGAVVEQVGPGIHYRLPWPVGAVDIVATTSVMKTGVGFDLPSQGAEATTPSGMELLTGDTNLLNIALVLQFVIRDPADFLFKAEHPRLLVDAVAQSALTREVAGMPIDDVLTTGRVALQERVRASTQAVLDRYGTGIQITSANIMAISLDRSVAQAFQDVADAMADREKLRNEARAYANDLIPKARGAARTALSEADAYKQRRIAEAVGETERYLALAKEYEKAPAITRSRIYLDAMERILPKVKLYVLDTKGGQAPLNLRVSAP